MTLRNNTYPCTNKKKKWYWNPREADLIQFFFRPSSIKRKSSGDYSHPGVFEGTCGGLDHRSPSFPTRTWQTHINRTRSQKTAVQRATSTRRSWGLVDTERNVLPGITRERSLRSKIWWFTEFCNSHYVSHFAAFFIVARTKISVARSCSSLDFLQGNDPNKVWTPWVNKKFRKLNLNSFVFRIKLVILSIVKSSIGVYHIRLIRKKEKKKKRLENKFSTIFQSRLFLSLY